MAKDHIESDPDSIAELDQSVAELKSILSEIASDDPLSGMLRRLVSHLIRRECARLAWLEGADDRMRRAIIQLNQVSGDRLVGQIHLQDREEHG